MSKCDNLKSISFLALSGELFQVYLGKLSEINFLVLIVPLSLHLFTKVSLNKIPKNKHTITQLDFSMTVSSRVEEVFLDSIQSSDFHRPKPIKTQ